MKDNFEDFFELMKTLLEKVSSSTDHREKNIGDKVRIWDGSANVDNKGRSRHGNDPMFTKLGIVSDTNCNKRFLRKGFLGEDDQEIILDIAIYFPDEDKTVWTKSEFIQLEDFE